MKRVLLIARYRDASMFRKAELLAREPDLLVRLIVPRQWRDELLRVEQQQSVVDGNLQRLSLPMIGSPADPHRSVYQTLNFGIASFHPDIIHAEEEPDSLAALQIALTRTFFARNAKLILHTWQNIDRPTGLPVRLVRRVTLAAADVVFCANQEAVDLLAKFGFRRPTPLIPALGVDTSLFQPCPVAQTGETFRIGYIGRLDVNKGLKTLVDAFAQLHVQNPQSKQQLELSFIGSGPFEEELRGAVHKAGLTADVTFIEAMAPTALAKEFCRLNVLVLPSLTTAVWKEQFGRVLTEAMASKIPVIGSDSGAIPEVIGDAGLIFPEGNAQALAHCLSQLWSSPLRCQELADRGFQRVAQQYTQQQIVAKTLEWYQHFT